jgi:hypothetical protein
MKQRLRRYRNTAWACGSAMIAAALVAGWAWKTQSGLALAIAHVGLVVSGLGAASSLILLHRHGVPSRQVDFFAGAGAYELQALGKL